jgi:site-specific DNA recombinase
VLRMQYVQGRGDPAVDVRAEQERVRLERKLASLDREVTRLIDAYQAEVIDLTELAERRQRIEDQGRMLRERVREIEQQRTERSTELRLLEGVDAFCTSVRGAMEGPSFTIQQKVLQLVVDRIVVEDSRVIIEHVIPTGPVRLQTEHQSCEILRFYEWVIASGRMISSNASPVRNPSFTQASRRLVPSSYAVWAI